MCLCVLYSIGLYLICGCFFFKFENIFSMHVNVPNYLKMPRALCGVVMVVKYFWFHLNIAMHFVFNMKFRFFLIFGVFPQDCGSSTINSSLACVFSKCSFWSILFDRIWIERKTIWQDFFIFLLISSSNKNVKFGCSFVQCFFLNFY